MTQVLDKTLDDQRRQFDLTHDRVAAAAQHAAHRARVVIVVDDELASGRVAEQAATTLRQAHRFDLGRREAVLPHEACADVLGPRGFGILPAPLTQTFVSTLAVRDAVCPVPFAGALAALAAGLAPVGVGGLGEISCADSAVQHESTLPRSTDTRLDQPCHADVLLELANAEESS